jgi:glutathione S-transferase
MYTVIGSPKTRALRVMWMLEELGQPYVMDPMPPGDARVEEINPSRKVPVLKDGDDYVIDSVAICQYLADRHGRLTFKAGTIDRAHQDSFTQFAVDDIELPLWVLAKHTFAIPKEYRVPDVKRACAFDFARAMNALSERLGTKTYVMGEEFTVPDLLIGHLGGWATSVGFEIPEGTVSEYINRVRSRPAFKTAMAKREQAA